MTHEEPTLDDTAKYNVPSSGESSVSRKRDGSVLSIEWKVDFDVCVVLNTTSSDQLGDKSSGIIFST